MRKNHIVIFAVLLFVSLVVLACETAQQTISKPQNIATQTCGNGVQEGTEECDDGDTLLSECQYGKGTCQVCGPSCTYVSSTGPICGDAIVQAEEQCDGSTMKTCEETAGFGYIGSVSCGSNCMIDTTACSKNVDISISAKVYAQSHTPEQPSRSIGERDWETKNNAKVYVSFQDYPYLYIQPYLNVVGIGTSSANPLGLTTNAQSAVYTITVTSNGETVLKTTSACKQQDTEAKAGATIPCEYKGSTIAQEYAETWLSLEKGKEYLVTADIQSPDENSAYKNNAWTFTIVTY